MPKQQFWFFIEKELTEIVHDLNEILQLNDSDRDYEDTWEWFETDTRDLDQADQYVNIAREHNWKQGVYECPVLLLIRNSNLKINEIGLYILNRLGVAVYYGDVVYNRGKYNYNKILEWEGEGGR